MTAAISGLCQILEEVFFIAGTQDISAEVNILMFLLLQLTDHHEYVDLLMADDEHHLCSYRVTSSKATTSSVTS